MNETSRCSAIFIIEISGIFQVWGLPEDLIVPMQILDLRSTKLFMARLYTSSKITKDDQKTKDGQHRPMPIWASGTLAASCGVTGEVNQSSEDGLSTSCSSEGTEYRLLRSLSILKDDLVRLC